jgi:type VI secretion system secreted protein VgrG
VDAIFTQQNRTLKITTPLGKDVLLLAGLSGQEAISSLFQFHLDLLAESRRQINFDELLGKKVAIEVTLPDDKTRYFSGYVNSFSQGARDQRFTRYRAEMVPQFWFLTRNAQSRIFQHVNIPDILKKVLQGLDVAFELNGNYQPRDYCVQYRESDFNFASRLMEEEGIYYFFKHTADSHKMVLADTPQSHADLGKIPYEELGGGTRDEERIHRWEKMQDLRSGKYTLWDHCFELPGKHLEAEKAVIDSVSAGTVTHKLKVGGNDKFEIYDYPGAYAQRFDGVDAGGGDSAGDLQKIFDDNQRTVGIRMQQETVPALVIHGASNCRHIVSGYKFTLANHFNANGSYVLTSISHVAQQGVGTGGNAADGDSHYSNVFTCIPFALPFRPLCSTPEPFVHGSHTATVVGPAGEEIFTDKYSRVKVQFHWDRQGKNDADSSCWVRVGTPWAGQNWGIVHIPRIGQEVIVDFLEGDPDQPIIVGSVYNADQMPPYKLPDNKTQSGIKTHSTPGGGAHNFNQIRFEDKKGHEQLWIHAENSMLESVEGYQTITVGAGRSETTGGEKDGATHGSTKELVYKHANLHVKGDSRLLVDGKVSSTVTGDEVRHTTGGYSVSSSKSVSVNAPEIYVQASTKLALMVGASYILLEPAGITLVGPMIKLNPMAAVPPVAPLPLLNDPPEDP